jgi:hypothetical protein
MGKTTAFFVRLRRVISFVFTEESCCPMLRSGIFARHGEQAKKPPTETVKKYTTIRAAVDSHPPVAGFGFFVFIF